MEIGGRTLLEITLTRLREFGVSRSDRQCASLCGDDSWSTCRRHDQFRDARSRFRAKRRLLDTGGGLKKAGVVFSGERRSSEPFLLHNVDVISTIDLGEIVKAHRDAWALATLAVQERETSRYLLFDEEEQLCGRRILKLGKDEIVRVGGDLEAMAFTGIHVISPRMLGMMREEGAFSIIDLYLRLAGAGEKVQGFRADGYYWRDLGKLQQVSEAEEDWRNGLFV